MKENLVIIGNGIATTRLLTELLALDDQRFNITVVGDEQQSGYNRILLSKWLAGDLNEDALLTQDRHWYMGRGIELRTGTRCTAIDPLHCTATLDDGTVLGWDKLVLATGARAFVPALPGSTLGNVFCFRNWQDCEHIMAAARPGARAIVIGAGLLGLEAAYGLNRRGLDVTVLHNANTIMNRQLDSTAGTMLAQSMAQRGIRIRTNVRTRALLGDSSNLVAGVSLDDDSSIDADLVVFATGIVPNKQLAEDAGLDTDRGICIDTYLKTSADNVYAIGECAQRGDICIGLVAPIHEQAPILAASLMGSTEHDGWVYQDAPTRLKVSGEEVFSAGDIDSTQGKLLRWQDPVSGHYRALRVHNQRLVSAVLYGDTEDGQFYADLIDRQVSVQPLRHTLLFGEQACEGRA